MPGRKIIDGKRGVYAPEIHPDYEYVLDVQEFEDICIKAKNEKKEEKKTEPKEETTVTIEQVRAVLAEKSQAGLTAEVKSLLESFGANKLSVVKDEDYAAVLAAAKDI